MAPLRWFYVYVPLHLAGSGGNRLVGKVRATDEEIARAFGRCARVTVDALGLSAVVEVWRRP